MNISKIFLSAMVIFMVLIMGLNIDTTDAMPMHHHDDILPILAAGIVIKLLESPSPWEN